MSWTLDVMRRRGDAFPGVMEILIASAVLELRDSVEVISFSGSPLAGRRRGGRGQRGPRDSEGLAGIWTWWAVRWSRCTDSFLATFKSRFKPDYRTLYLYYQDPLQLPAMGRALSRAYLPAFSPPECASAPHARALIRGRCHFFAPLTRFGRIHPAAQQCCRRRPVETAKK